MSGEHEPIAEAEAAPSAPEHGQPGPLGLLALAGAGRTTLPAAVLALQRQAGNRGVNRLVRQRAIRGAPRPPAARAPSRTLQRRRLPQPSALVDILSDVGPAGRVAAPDSSAHMAGLNRLWARISSDLTVAERSDLMAQGITGMTVAQLTALPLADQTAKLAQGTAALQALKPWELQERWAQALSTVKPARMLGDPLLIDVGPRPGTSDAANIQTVVDNTNKVFDEIAAGARDQDIKDVFGAANLATAKTKYKNARKRMNELRAANKIVTDRSGYNAEAGLGGLTNDSQISVAPSVIDSPAEKESIVIMFHESMHAGNADVDDKGYIDATSFTKAAVTIKLTNAAHFEVVARRSVKTTLFQFAGETFTPAGSTAPGGAVTAALTPREQAVSAASEMFRQAWTIGLNLHTLFVRLVRTPTDWDTVDLKTEFGGVSASGLHFSDCLPFWSKVEAMTIHERTQIKPAGGDPSTNPVTLIDIALSEGTIRRLARGRKQMKLTDAEALAFEQANATAAEISGATTVDAERDLLILLALRSTPTESISDDLARDVKTVLKMGSMQNTWTDMLQQRSPATFP